MDYNFDYFYFFRESPCQSCPFGRRPCSVVFTPENIECLMCYSLWMIRYILFEHLSFPLIYYYADSRQAIENMNSCWPRNERCLLCTCFQFVLRLLTRRKETSNMQWRIRGKARAPIWGGHVPSWKLCEPQKIGSLTKIL